MSKFNIAIIKFNNYNIKEDVKDISKEDIKKDLEKLVEIREVTQNTMMENIIEVLKLTTHHVADSALCYEDDKNVYQLCNMRLLDTNNSNGKGNFNCLGTLLTTTKETIYGDSVLIKSKITEDNTCIDDSIDIDDIVNLYYSKIVHKTVSINADGEISELLFRKSPFENMDKDMLNNYRYIDHNILGFVFQMHIEVIPTKDKVNKKMTILKGNSIIKGNVILLLKTHEYNFLDIDKKLLKKILCLCEGSIKGREISEDEKQNRKEFNNKIIVMNPFCILEKRYKKYCENNKNKNKKLTCRGCFRMKYETLEEQKRDWLNHSKECLFKKKETLNEFLLNELRVMKHKEQIKEDMDKELKEDHKAVLEYN